MFGLGFTDRFLTEAVHLGFAEDEVARLVARRSRQFQWNPARPTPAPKDTEEGGRVSP